MNIFDNKPKVGAWVITKAETLRDMVNDHFTPKLRWFDRIQTKNGVKRRLRDEFDSLCNSYSYIGFEADLRGYAAHIVG